MGANLNMGASLFKFESNSQIWKISANATPFWFDEIYGF